MGAHEMTAITREELLQRVQTSFDNLLNLLQDKVTLDSESTTLVEQLKMESGKPLIRFTVDIVLEEDANA
jgi:hypothetical protein